MDEKITFQKLDRKQSNYIQQHGGCPDCYHQLLAGPRGGSSINVKCINCGHEFNVTPPPFAVERISSTINDGT